MALEFLLPDVGEGTESAEILEWHVSVGDQVQEDQPLVDIQTDKATVVIPCPTTASVLELRAQPGDLVNVGDVLAVFSATAGAPDTATNGGAESSGAESSEVPPEVSLPAVVVTTDDPRAVTRPLASPAIRRLARAMKVDLSSIAGSGPAGRITRDDLPAEVPENTAAPNRSPADPDEAAQPSAEAARSKPGSVAGPKVPAPADSIQLEGDKVVPLRGARRAVAHAMTESWQTIPHVIDYREVDASALIRSRVFLREHAQRADDERLAKALTITPLVIKMVCSALAQHPMANSSIDLGREEITVHSSIHIGVAVAAPQALVVPVVRDAQTKSVAEIALEVTDLVTAAREQRLTPAQLRGGTFTVNNYGALGIWLGTPIIPPGQVVNFGLGKLESRPVVREGEIVARPIIPIAVSGDHRVLDGHTLAALVTDVVELMQCPTLLMADLR